MRVILFVAIIVFNVFSSRGQSNFSASSLLSSKYNGKYIGGVNKYSPIYAAPNRKYDYTVSTKAELLKVLKLAKSYQTIFINGKASIDLTDQGVIYIKTGIKLISDRGLDDSKGALLFSSNSKAFPLFECGSYVSFIGLRIAGNDNNVYHNNKKKGSDFNKNTYGAGVTQGIRSKFANLLVENCELSGFSHSAIFVGGQNAKIIYSYIHHNRRHGLGYGVTVDGGSALIQGNLFDFNRHSIASTGVKNSSYTVKNNIFLENGTSHVVDVHGGKDRKDNTNIAGESFLVNDNYFRLKSSSGGAFVIRGIPTKKADFSNNTIDFVDNGVKALGKSKMENKYIKQNNAKGNFSQNNNIFR